MYKDGAVPAGAAEAPAYNATGSNGTSMDGPVNHTESGRTSDNDGVGMGGKACEICDKEADGECQMESAREGCARVAANQAGVLGLSNVVMGTGCPMSGAVTSQRSWCRRRKVTRQRRHL